MKARTLAAAVILAAALPVQAQEPLILSPQQIGEIFCIASVGNDMAPVEAIVTPELAAALAEARAKNAAYEADHPGEKPPLGDGIPWQDAPDYAPECSVGAVSYMMDEATVEIAHGFPDYPEANFTDTLRLRLVPDPAFGAPRWRIANLAYASDLDLRAALESAFMN